MTNLGVGRAISSAHVDYYRRRAEGGAGVIVTETASVHSSDWPYERAPLAAECSAGWSRVVEACRPHGTVVLAGLGHRGLEGSSAHNRAALWGPSAVADPGTRELPAIMESGEIRALTAGFVAASRSAVAAGCDGVEIDAGPRSLLRQFLSDLTNHRRDAYGRDRALFLAEVLDAVRAAIGGRAWLALRVSCDEGVAWGGIGPDQAATAIRRVAPAVDVLTVVRGGLYTADEYRPGMHTTPGFNTRLCRRMRSVVGGRVAVVLQGSVVDIADADRALTDGTADFVEMTRAQIADPGLVVRAGSGAAPRPCLRCNQACMVDDARNPLVDCVVRPWRPEPAARPAAPGGVPRRALVIGAGVAGLAAARILAQRGTQVTVVERAMRPGGMLRTAAVARPGLALLVDWLEDECVRLGVGIECGAADGATRGARAVRTGLPVVQATGSMPRPAAYPYVRRIDAAALLAGAGASGSGVPDGPVLVWDPIGGPVGAAVAEWLVGRGGDVAIATPDPVVGAELARAGDLSGANVRLQRAGVDRHVFSIIRGHADGEAVLEHPHTGVRTTVPCAAVVDCSPRLPGPTIDGAIRVGDCIAPRTALEAMREGEAAGERLAAG